MVSKNIVGTPFQRMWYAWRSYQFPWRKTYFIGMDLEGNTFWEYRDRIAAHRPRRTVVFKDKTLDWVDYASAVSPAWHQWLRATRVPAPTIEEQLADVVRRKELAKNAALADARWAAKASLLNAGPHPPPESVLESNTKFCSDSGMQRDQKVGRGEVGADLGGKGSEVRTGAGVETGDRAHGLRREDPWAEAEAGKAKGFKPGEWDPNSMLPADRGRRRSH